LDYVLDSSLKYPMYCFVHTKAGRVELRLTIKFIFTEKRDSVWDKRIWPKHPKDIGQWQSTLHVVEIIPFDYPTNRFQHPDGSFLEGPPQTYARVLVPETSMPASSTSTPAGSLIVPERFLEEFVLDRLPSIGLTLVDRQVTTPSGRLDLLCKDEQGNYVVVELKKMTGTDKVVGQTLRYIGWAQTHYGTQNVRGLIIVREKDRALEFAAKAVPNITVKVLKISLD
jgi:hypothetical protein